MPYAHETRRLRIPTEPGSDRRVKLSCSDKAAIREAHVVQGASIRQLAYQFKVSRRTIQFLLYPERAVENQKRRAERGGSKVYYDREAHADSMRGYRRHKKQLHDAGVLLEPSGTSVLR